MCATLCENVWASGCWVWYESGGKEKYQERMENNRPAAVFDYKAGKVYLGIAALLQQWSHWMNEIFEGSAKGFSFWLNKVTVMSQKKVKRANPDYVY